MGGEDVFRFVFGNQFLYTACKQWAGNRPTSLRVLDRGSVILFGSNRHGQFVLDTVFAVSHWIEHSRATFQEVLRGEVSDTYAAVTLSPWYGCVFDREKPVCRPEESSTSPQSFRLYYGAMFAEKVDGMYSFFPCQPYAAVTRGFERPVIRIGGVITDNLSQSKRITLCATTAGAKDIWEQVVEQVTSKGLSLGVQADLPECLNGKSVSGIMG